MRWIGVSLLVSAAFSQERLAHRTAGGAASLAGEACFVKAREIVSKEVRAARKGDGVFMDHCMNGRAAGPPRRSHKR